MADPEQVAMLLRSVDEWNAWRQDNPEIRPDLSRSDLTEARIAGADLRDAILSESTLSGIDAERVRFDEALMNSCRCSMSSLFAIGDRQEVRLTHSVFRGASFNGATLGNSNFDGADFSECDFTATKFLFTKLIDCRMRHATFHDAVFGMTTFGNVDLASTEQLADAQHLGPSVIATGTLRTSQGRIADSFLRGCGFSEIEVLLARLWDTDLTGDELTTLLYRIHDMKTTAPIQKRHVFISYTHTDAGFVETIEKRFDARGIRYWRDVHELKAGRIETQIDRAINLHSIVLLVLSKSSVNSDWVEWEIAKARAIEKQHKRDVICPIALDDSWKTADWPGPLRRQIEDYHILDFSSPSEGQFAKLIDGLNLYY